MCRFSGLFGAVIASCDWRIALTVLTWILSRAGVPRVGLFNYRRRPKSVCTIFGLIGNIGGANRSLSLMSANKLKCVANGC